MNEESDRLAALYESVVSRTALLEQRIGSVALLEEQVRQVRADHAKLTKLFDSNGRAAKIEQQPRFTGDRNADVELPRSDMQILIEVSPGELIDKLTILEIKLDNISDPAKLANVRAECDSLRVSLHRAIPDTPEIAELTAQLKTVNLQLWKIEDDIRLHERRSDFDERFVSLARSVYRTNDRRATIKRSINVLLKSKIVEEKSYTDY